MSFNDTFARFGDKVIIKHRFLFLFLFLVLLVFGVLGIKQLILDNSYASMLEKDNPINVKNRYYQEYFGNSDYAFIMVEAENTTSPEVLEQIRSLCVALEDSLPFVKEVKSFTNLEFLEADEESINAGKLIEADADIPTSDSALALLRKRILGKRMYRDRMTNADLTQSGIFVTFETLGDTAYVRKGVKTPFAADIVSQDEAGNHNLEGYKMQKNPLMLITPALYQLLENHQNPSCRFCATGVPVISYNVNSVLMKEAVKSFLLTLLLVMGVLFFLYRSVREVLAPVGLIFASVIITFGTIGWLQIVVSTFALIVALLLMVISVSYSIHIINHFRKSFDHDGDRLKAVHYTYLHAGWACFLSAVTTMVGFASFVFVDMVPVRNLGITSAIGVVVVYLLAVFLLPVLLSFGKNKPVAVGADGVAKGRMLDFNLQKVPVFSIHYAKKVFAVSFVLVVAFGYLITRVQADTDFINLFGERNAFVRDANHCTENLGSLYSYEVLIELPEAGMAKTPEVLLAEDRLDSLINTFPITKFTSSVNDLIKDVNQTLHMGDTAYYCIPSDAKLLSQYLLLYEMAGGNELEKCIDLDYRQIRHSVRIRRSTTDLQQDFDRIVEFGSQIFPLGTRISIVGDMSVFLRAVSFLVRGQVVSLLFSFAGIFIVLLLVSRSLRETILIMVPNIIPVFFIGGVMGAMGITLNLQTIVAAPVIMGLAVDDTIHYVLFLKEEFRKNRNYLQANVTTFQRIGSGIVNTSLILFVGFLTFFFTPVNSLHNISLLLLVGVVVALVADLLLTPALMAHFKAFGKEENNNF